MKIIIMIRIVMNMVMMMKILLSHLNLHLFAKILRLALHLSLPLLLHHHLYLLLLEMFFPFHWIGLILNQIQKNLIVSVIIMIMIIITKKTLHQIYPKTLLKHCHLLRTLRTVFLILIYQKF